MYFDNEKNTDCIINYYKKMDINNCKYFLISFIMDKDEEGKKEKDKNYNVFYLRDNIWYI